MKTLNFGSLNLDKVYSVDHTVRPGETTASERLEFFCGGKGLNQSIALSRAGEKVYHAGCVGTDGKSLLNKLKENGVDISLVKESTSVSGHAIIQVDKNGQNSILIFGGANFEITEKQASEVLSHFEKGDRIILQNEISNVSYIINSAYDKGIEIIFNPSPFDDKILSFPLQKISWFVVNETEAKELTGESEPSKILGKFSEKHPSSNVLLTLGGDGAFCKIKDKIYFQDIFKVPVVDTTAAGDTFLGFFFALISKMPAQKALEYASAASAVAVSCEGASASIPNLSEVEKFLTQNSK